MFVEMVVWTCSDVGSDWFVRCISSFLDGSLRQAASGQCSLPGVTVANLFCFSLDLFSVESFEGYLTFIHKFGDS